jgi:hypothetical protein
VVVKDGRVVELVEAKLSEEKISTSLGYYAERLKPMRALQVVGDVRARGWQKGALAMTSVLEEFR